MLVRTDSPPTNPSARICRDWVEETQTEDAVHRRWKALSMSWHLPMRTAVLFAVVFGGCFVTAACDESEPSDLPQTNSAGSAAYTERDRVLYDKATNDAERAAAQVDRSYVRTGRYPRNVTRRTLARAGIELGPGNSVGSYLAHPEVQRLEGQIPDGRHPLVRFSVCIEHSSGIWYEVEYLDDGRISAGGDLRAAATGCV